MAAAVHSELHRPAAMLLEQIGNLVRERPGGLVVLTGDGGPDKFGGASLVYRVEDHRDVIALRIFEEDDRTFSGDEEIAGGVTQEIPEHVSGARRVALVIGVEKDHRAVTGSAHPVAKLLQTPVAQGVGVDKGRFRVRKPHAAGRIGCLRMAHPVLEVHVIHAVGIEYNNAHDILLFQQDGEESERAFAPIPQDLCQNPRGFIISAPRPRGAPRPLARRGGERCAGHIRTAL